jgi:hypothetical protein
MAAIPMGKARKVENPYIIITDGSWEWRVLKAYSADPDKQYARWFCAVKSPFTYGGWDMGDTYIEDVVRGGGYITHLDESVPESALPKRLRGKTAKSVTPLGNGITFIEVG